ncbi:MAG: hypothetical protein R3C26_07930 [Calditrichia bacterium]
MGKKLQCWQPNAARLEQQRAVNGEPHLIIFSASGDELSCTRLPRFAANQLRINPVGDQFW